MRTTLCLLALGLAGTAPAAIAQSEGAPVPTTVEDALHSMADRAGVIFVGSVLSIRHIAGKLGSSGAVEVAFTVEQAVRGCTPGSTYTLREWAGLWMSDDQRYLVGQRRLMLLHAPGRGGLSAPVDGTDGAIPVHGTATRVGPESTLTAEAAPAAVADLRWIAAGHVRRSAPVAIPSAGLLGDGVHGAPLQGVAVRAQGSGAAAQTSVLSAPAAASPIGPDVLPGAAAQLQTLLHLMAGWEVSRAR